jgi:hypothetical protein
MSQLRVDRNTISCGQYEQPIFLAPIMLQSMRIITVSPGVNS